MKYMLLMVGVHADDDPAETAAPNPPASSAADPDEPCWMPWYREMTARGAHLLQGDRLQPASTATTVELVNGDVLLSDGPFAETKEQILGYHIIDVADLDEAVYVASRHPVATNGGGRVEVRPILVS
jgi:hypothetical protein